MGIEEEKLHLVGAETVHSRTFFVQYPANYSPNKQIFAMPTWLVQDTDSHIPTMALIVLPDGKNVNEVLHADRVYTIDYSSCAGGITFDNKQVRTAKGTLIFSGLNRMHFKDFTFTFTDGSTMTESLSAPPPLLMNTMITEHLPT